jgi:hypothetical protein
MHKALSCGAALCCMALLVCRSEAQTNLIVNGDFENTTGQSSGQWDSHYPYVNVTGWSSAGYNFIFTPGSADTTGVYSSENTKQLILWGPNNSTGGNSNNGLPATSPTGGNFVGADGAYQVGAITQAVSGLKVGHTYQLNFYWAAAQQHGYTGDTTERWEASLGNSHQYTPIYDLPSHGFSGWMSQSFDYTATAATETLTFLAIGTPTGVPPFALLDGVSMYDTSETATPEPGMAGLAISGMLTAGFALRKRRSNRRS